MTAIRALVLDDQVHDSPGADLLPEQWDDVDELVRAAVACYGRPVVRVLMEAGDLGVQIHARGLEPTTYYPDGFDLWRDEYGRPVRWETVYRDELPAAIRWEVIR